MANKQEEKSEEEKKKEANRDFALKMMDDKNLRNLAATYLIEQGDWGENVKFATENELYMDSFQEGMKYLDPKKLEESREEGKRYTGVIKEKDILENSFARFQTNLHYMKVNDVLKDIGAKPDEKYGEKYVNDLDKEKQKSLIGIYQQVFGYNKVSETTKGYSNNVINTINENGLEKMIKGDKENKKEQKQQ